MTKEENEKQDIRKRLNDLAQKARRPIFEASTLSFFDFSRNKISIEIDRVNIFFRQFFSSGEIRSISIKDLGEIILDSTPFSASLKIIVRRPGPETVLILKPLRKKDAFKARRIIEGLIIADRLGIDFTQLEPEEVAKRAEELGQATEPKL